MLYANALLKRLVATIGTVIFKARLLTPNDL